MRPSVCATHYAVSPIKTVQARIEKSSLWAATKTLDSRDKIVYGWRCQRELLYFSQNASHFIAIDSSSIQTVADRYRLGAYHNKHPDNIS